MKKIHSVQVKNSNPAVKLFRSNSVKSTGSLRSIKSPPPKKILNKIKPEDTPLPADTEDSEMDIEEDLRLAKLELKQLI